jgi:hypothetical protein
MTAGFETQATNPAITMNAITKPVLATIAYRHPIGPCWSFIKVAPTAALRDLLVRKYRALGWEYFTTFKDVNGYGVSAARYAGF